MFLLFSAISLSHVDNLRVRHRGIEANRDILDADAERQGHFSSGRFFNGVGNRRTFRDRCLNISGSRSATCTDRAKGLTCRRHSW